MTDVYIANNWAGTSSCNMCMIDYCILLLKNTIIEDNISIAGAFFTVVYSLLNIEDSFLTRNQGLETANFRLLEGRTFLYNVTISEPIASQNANFKLTSGIMTIENSEIFNITNKNCLGDIEQRSYLNFTNTTIHNLNGTEYALKLDESSTVVFEQVHIYDIVGPHAQAFIKMEKSTLNTKDLHFENSETAFVHATLQDTLSILSSTFENSVTNHAGYMILEKADIKID